MPRELTGYSRRDLIQSNLHRENRPAELQLAEWSVRSDQNPRPARRCSRCKTFQLRLRSESSACENRVRNTNKEGELKN
jgi:hypothetical protein